MLNSTHFLLLAGRPQKWDDEIRNECPKGRVSGTYASGPLCRMQANQSARGRRSANLVLSIYGWTVRYASGLQDFSIMFRSGSFDPSSALQWGTDWANADPNNRELYVGYWEIECCEKKGHDCSALRNLQPPV